MRMKATEPKVYLDKTTYQYFITCPCYAWHKYHKPNFDVIETQFQAFGIQIEALAHQLFDEGVEITGPTETAVQATKELLPSLEEEAVKPKKGQPTVIYQATVASDDGLLVKADIVLVNHQRKSLAIYEVKAVSDRGPDFAQGVSHEHREQHLQDIGFQRLAFESCGYTVSQTCLIYLNKNYVYDGQQHNLQDMFVIRDVTILTGLNGIHCRARAQAAKACLAQEEAPTCQCRYKAKTKRCPKFMEFNDDIPPQNSIFDLRRASPKLLKTLMSHKFLYIKDIDRSLKDFDLTDHQLNQYRVITEKEPIINYMHIIRFLERLETPLYFLDYETISYPQPVFTNTSPYQQIAFQYSLHVWRHSLEQTVTVLKEQPREEIKAEHYEYLMTEPTDEQLQQLVGSLQQNIGKKGSILVWHKSAESGFHDNLSRAMPPTKVFFQNLNSRLVDLETIFTSQAYVHADFNGSTSLKKVLPVLVPEMNYSDLNIQEGLAAQQEWDNLRYEMPKVREQKLNDLRKYCQRDTEVMVHIYFFLVKLIGVPEAEASDD